MKRRDHAIDPGVMVALMGIACVSRTPYAVSSVDNQHLQSKPSTVTHHPARPGVSSLLPASRAGSTYGFWLNPTTATRSCSLGVKVERGVIAGETLCSIGKSRRRPLRDAQWSLGMPCHDHESESRSKAWRSDVGGVHQNHAKEI